MKRRLYYTAICWLLHCTGVPWLIHWLFQLKSLSFGLAGKDIYLERHRVFTWSCCVPLCCQMTLVYWLLLRELVTITFSGMGKGLTTSLSWNTAEHCGQTTSECSRREQPTSSLSSPVSPTSFQQVQQFGGFICPLAKAHLQWLAYQHLSSHGRAS